MIYTFECRACEHVWEQTLKMADMEQPLGEPCPECGVEGQIHQIVGGNHAFMRPEQLGRKKAPEDFRNFLTNIKKKNPGCHIRDH